MIFLTKLGGKQFLLNEMLVESINQTPDTIVTMSNGHTYVVQERLEEILDKIITFNRFSKHRLTRNGTGADEQTKP